MDNNIIYKILTIDDVNNNLLENFNRYQEIKKSWCNQNGTWILVNDNYIIDMDNETKEKEVKYLSRIIREGGYVLGAFDYKKLIGFLVLLTERFGTKDQYIELKLLHISSEYRGMGIGKKLFMLCVERVKEIGINKIYISANSSEETINFYINMGCVDAIEINKKIIEERPKDRQMEYII